MYADETKEVQEEIQEEIDGCEVILRFSDNPDIKSENMIIDILMSAFEQRVHNSLGLE